MIRFRTIVLSATLWIACAPLAGAQSIDNGTEVRVNPVAGSGNVLLYPGGEYMRVVPQLLEPGQNDRPIRLHMPTHRPARIADTEEKPETSGYVSNLTGGAPKPRPAPRPKVAKAAEAPSPPADTSGYVSNITGDGQPQGAASLFQYGSAPPAPKPKTQVARAEPAPAQTQVPGLTKQSMILFAHDAADPAQSALGNLKLLAVQLNGAMTSPGARVEIQAYGGAKGDKGSDARRLSLKRALAIRDVLIEDGVPSERINVHAMGGVDDGGPTDRVDVYTKA